MTLAADCRCDNQNLIAACRWQILSLVCKKCNRTSFALTHRCKSNIKQGTLVVLCIRSSHLKLIRLIHGMEFYISEFGHVGTCMGRQTIDNNFADRKCLIWLHFVRKQSNTRQCIKVYTNNATR